MTQPRRVVGGVDGGYGNWWLRPTLPADVAPGVLRLALAAGTGLGLALVVTQLIKPMDGVSLDGSDLDGSDVDGVSPTAP